MTVARPLIRAAAIVAKPAMAAAMMTPNAPTTATESENGIHKAGTSALPRRVPATHMEPGSVSAVWDRARRL
jgi:hypothetical protein